MNELWQLLETWLQTNWPEGKLALNPPATLAEITDLETALGTKLPRDFVSCLMVHNGQSGSAGGLFDNSEFLSTHAIYDQWSVWNELLHAGTFEDVESEADEGVRTDWWHAKWIPFTHNGGGDHYCLDLAPESGGSIGQVITMWHDSGERELLTKNFHEWFEKYVQAVLSGAYTYSEDFGGLVLIDAL
jgi:cell wall assembly regulator SMI1